MEKQDFEQFQELETVMLQKELVLKDENIKVLGKVLLNLISCSPKYVAASLNYYI